LLVTSVEHQVAMPTLQNKPRRSTDA
jgi:hypothetical protein